jgi:hypothetical protein
MARIGMERLIPRKMTLCFLLITSFFWGGGVVKMEFLKVRKGKYKGKHGGAQVEARSQESS